MNHTEEATSRTRDTVGERCMDSLSRKVNFWLDNEELIESLCRKITRNSPVELRVLRSLLRAEVANIRAKTLDAGDAGRNYSMKRRQLMNAIMELPSTGWTFFYQKRWPESPSIGNYVFYVVLPGGQQVSWHGLDYRADMVGVPERYDISWDGCEGVTLERLVRACCQSTQNLMK